MPLNKETKLWNQENNTSSLLWSSLHGNYFSAFTPRKLPALSRSPLGHPIEHLLTYLFSSLSHQSRVKSKLTFLSWYLMKRSLFGVYTGLHDSNSIFFSFWYEVHPRLSLEVTLFTQHTYLFLICSIWPHNQSFCARTSCLDLRDLLFLVCICFQLTSPLLDSQN